MTFLSVRFSLCKAIGAAVDKGTIVDRATAVHRIITRLFTVGTVSLSTTVPLPTATILACLHAQSTVNGYDGSGDVTCVL